jgi:hypothetical protein
MTSHPSSRSRRLSASTTVSIPVVNSERLEK